MPQPVMLKKESSTVLWIPTRTFRINTQKRCPFNYRGLECKSRKSRKTWSNSKFRLVVQNEAGKSLIEFCQENALVIENILFQQHKRRLYTWTAPVDQYWNKIDYILCSWRWRSSIHSAKTRLGAHVAQIMNSLLLNSYWNGRKWKKTTRPVSSDLNQPLMIIQWKWEIDSRDLIW